MLLNVEKSREQDKERSWELLVNTGPGQNASELQRKKKEILVNNIFSISRNIFDFCKVEPQSYYQIQPFNTRCRLLTLPVRKTHFENIVGKG